MQSKVIPRRFPGASTTGKMGVDIISLGPLRIHTRSGHVYHNGYSLPLVEIEKLILSFLTQNIDTPVTGYDVHAYLSDRGHALDSRHVHLRVSGLVSMLSASYDAAGQHFVYGENGHFTFVLEPALVQEAGHGQESQTSGRSNFTAAASELSDQDRMVTVGALQINFADRTIKNLTCNNVIGLDLQDIKILGFLAKQYSEGVTRNRSVVIGTATGLGTAEVSARMRNLRQTLRSLGLPYICEGSIAGYRFEIQPNASRVRRSVLAVSSGNQSINKLRTP